jgi:hypothetical protein
MQRNQMTTAVIAGLAGACGIGETTAASLNPDRLGQVLLYPYYTVDGVERSADADRGRVVKVRFLEAYTSREVLDFNLFLSPKDVWTSRP